MDKVTDSKISVVNIQKSNLTSKRSRWVGEKRHSRWREYHNSTVAQKGKFV